MASGMRKPESLKIDLPGDDWIVVKKHLTAGEQRRMFKLMMDGHGGIEPVNVGLSKMVAFLLDWSITDADDKPIVIEDQPDNFKIQALDNLTPKTFKKVLKAIEAHEAAMDLEEDDEKKTETTSPPI